MKTYFRLLSYARPFRRFVPIYFVLAMLAVLFGLANFTLIIPLLNVLFSSVEPEQVTELPAFSFSIHFLKNTFNYYFNGIVATHGKQGALQFVAAIIFTSVLFANLFRFLSQKVLASMRTYAIKNIREDVFRKLTDLHIGYFYNHRKGEIISTLSNDVQEVENSIVSSVQIIFREPLMLVSYFIALFAMSVKLTLFTLLILPISFGIISFISKKLRKDASRSQQLLGNILSIIDETVSGARIIKAFNAQAVVREKFNKENWHYANVLKSSMNRRELASPLSEFMGVGVITVILLYGGMMVLNNESELSASEFIAYLIIYSQVLVPAKAISSSVTYIQKGLVSGERIFAILDSPPQLLEAEKPLELTSFNECIEFKNVSFAYNNFNNEYVLNNLSFKIEKGKSIALVGQSGAGKSTIADLIPRFYDCSQGEILIDGKNVKDVSFKSLRGLMGIVTQESVLFNDTILNNIAFGKEKVSEADVMEAAKIANAHQFITETEAGYETNIGDRGGKLSGGQRQRISIARAVLKNPSILILDEATSALDTESESLVQDALYKLMEGRTSLIIAHRLSTILRADEIIVLKKGVLVERGTHNELIAKNGAYRKLYDMQSFD